MRRPGSTLLVVSTVHAADDVRIREKLIRSLTDVAVITYATKGPEPTDRDGLAEWRELPGGRIRRNLVALRMLFSRRHAACVVHDPELIPGAILAAVFAKRRIVVDIHEHIPGLFDTRERLPKRLRPAAAWWARRMLRLAERTCAITLAEPGYQASFRRPHPVFANYPDRLPPPVESDGSVVYVGDVTEARGLTDLAAAIEKMQASLTVRVIGRCDPDLAARLGRTPGIEVLGRLPHADAMEIVRRAAVGVSPLRDLPNYRYSLPTKVVEYLGVGIAVVATDLPGTSEIIGDRPGVRLVPAGDIDALAEALDQAVADSEHRTLATTNVDQTRAMFRWPHDEVVAFYKEILTG
jgi:glycosyltransferase involved in cell wall biosynthesis